MTTTILECKQLDANIVRSNGDWTTILSNQITLNSGDSLILRNVFIDTVTESSGYVVIDEDTTISIGFMLYNSNNVNTNKIYADTTNQPDGKKYIACTQVLSPTGGYKIEQIKFETKDSGFNWGGIPVRFSYDDINGDKKYWTYEIDIDPPSPVYATPNLVAKEGTFVLVTSQKTLNDALVVYDGITQQDPVESHMLEPAVYWESTQIKKGSYTPEQFAQTVTDGLSKVNSVEYSDKPSTSKLLQSSDDVSTFYGKQVYMVCEDGTNMFNWDNSASDKYWVGTNQIALVYDDAIGSFTWTYIHMPWYDNSGNFGVQYISHGATSYYFLATSTGGILFNTLLPGELWETIGFVMSSIIPTPELINVTIGGVDYLSPNFTLVAGQHYTQGYDGLDTVVQKTADFQIVPTMPPPISIIQNTVQIFANNQFKPEGVKGGYFEIDITGIQTTTIGEGRISHALNGIVDKYYSQASYTSGSEVSGIAYTHSGEPLTLSSFNIRILDSDHQLAENIGADNSIFIEVISQEQVQVQKK